MSRDEKIFRKLFLIAIAIPPVARCRLAAALVLRNNILAIGVPSYSSTKLARQYRSHKLRLWEHAEVAALRNYIGLYGFKNLSKCTLYICRVKRNGPRWVTGCAKPCRGCRAALAAFGIRKIKST